jgi:hypothetical protein
MMSSMIKPDTPLPILASYIRGLGPKSCASLAYQNVNTAQQILDYNGILPGVNLERIKESLRQHLSLSQSIQDIRNQNEAKEELQIEIPIKPKLDESETIATETKVTKEIDEHSWMNSIMYLPSGDGSTVRRVLVQELVYRDSAWLVRVKWYSSGWHEKYVSIQHLAHIWLLYQLNIVTEDGVDVYQPDRAYKRVDLKPELLTFFVTRDEENDAFRRIEQEVAIAQHILCLRLDTI